jgi:hypothetical protein
MNCIVMCKHSKWLLRRSETHNLLLVVWAEAVDVY